MALVKQSRETFTKRTTQRENGHCVSIMLHSRNIMSVVGIALPILGEDAGLNIAGSIIKDNT